MADPSHAPEFRSAIVTGGGGLIGRHAVTALCDRGWKVTAVGRSARPASLDQRSDYQTLDLTAPDAAQRLFESEAPHVLLHLAWVTEHGRFWTALDNLDWVAASLRLVKAFAQGGGRRVVAAGTCVEYVPPALGPCVAGHTTIEPQYLYASAKDAFHRLTTAFCAQEGLSHAWGRVFLVTGAGEAQKRFVPSIICALLAGTPAQCSSGRQIRDIMDARDCGAAFATLAASDRSGQVNVCSGIPVPLGDVARRIGGMMGRPDLINLGALPDRPGESPNLWGDAGSLADVGFKPRYSLEQALADAIDHWRKQAEWTNTEKRGKIV